MTRMKKSVRGRQFVYYKKALFDPNSTKNSPITERERERDGFH